MIKERVGLKEPISCSALVEPICAVIRDTPDARLLQENGGGGQGLTHVGSRTAFQDGAYEIWDMG